jgi:SAM-dependent methyltransferase
MSRSLELPYSTSTRRGDQRVQDIYDTVEYPGFVYADTHPDQLAVMALLYGLEPAPVEHCRVLEIACNEGANIIPMAYAIPGGEFLGFDLAPECVARGQERIRQLGLKNIRLFQANLLDVGPELGAFDYIIAHGLYAWVPEPVRDRLLALCGQHLAPNGIAFVSYNALPGSYLRKMSREMMLARTQGIEDPQQRVKEGVAFITSIVNARPEGDVYRALFEEQLKRFANGRIPALYHDDFSPSYHPVYFSQFVEHAGRHGLQYLSDAVLPPPNDPCFNAEFQSAIKPAATDVVAQEQMIDFARMRMYRETLLCRADRKLTRNFPAEQFRRLFFASSAASSPGETETEKDYILSGGGTKLHCNQEVTIAVMEKLISAWPHALSFDEIMPVLEANGITAIEQAAKLLLQMAVAKMIELHTWNPSLANAISERPRATATSRLEAKTHAYTSTLRHFQVELTDAVGRHFLQLLDGTRDRAALLAALKAGFPETPVEELEQGMEPNLNFAYRATLLEA